MATADPPQIRPRAAVTAVAIGFGAIMFDGYDLIVYGSGMPAPLRYEPWGLTATQAGPPPASGSAGTWGCSRRSRSWAP